VLAAKKRPVLKILESPKIGDIDMYEAIFLILGLFAGAILTRKVSVTEMKKSPWQRIRIAIRRFLGLDGGAFDGGTEQECVYFCNDVKFNQTCKEGSGAAGKCLDDLIGKCSETTPNV